MNSFPYEQESDLKQSVVETECELGERFVRLISIWLVGVGMMAVWATMYDVNPMLLLGVASVFGGLVLTLLHGRLSPTREAVGRRRPGPECECRLHLRDVVHASWNSAKYAHNAHGGVDLRLRLANHLMTVAIQWQYGRVPLGPPYTTIVDEAVKIGYSISVAFGERVEACLRQQNLAAADGLAAYLMSDLIGERGQLRPKMTV